MLASRYITALPRFLWWGFRRASWVERAIVITGFLLLLGLVWPADDGDAAQGLHSWPSANVAFEFAGTGWGTLSAADRAEYQGGVRDALAEWVAETDFSPSIGTHPRNDIHWGDRPAGWNGSCSAYTSASQSFAKACKRFNNYWHITESDVYFNHLRNWTGPFVAGIATHEFGHTGGLNHDHAHECTGGASTRFTMCPEIPADHRHEWSSLEDHDIDDMNQKY